MIRKIKGFFFGNKPVEFIKAKKIQKYVNVPNWTIVDIRPGGEFVGEHVLSSINIPQTSFAKKSRKKIHPREKIILICRNGRVATNAYHILKERRFNHVRVVKGGINKVHELSPELMYGTEIM